MRKIKQFTDKPEQQRAVVEQHSHGLGCIAHNCPLVGVHGANGGWVCWAHDRLEEASQWPYLTQGIRNNQWLFRVADKVAGMPLYDLEQKAAEIAAYLVQQGRSDLVRMKNDGSFSERCELEPRTNWAMRLRSAAYAKAVEYINDNWTRAA